MTWGRFNDAILFLIRAYGSLERSAKIRLREEFWPRTYIISLNVGTNEVISRVYIFTCIVCSPFLLLVSL